METRPSSPRLVGKPAPIPERLESWKEIAEYLHRDVRTVQRWERSKELPVRRLPGGVRARVFALRSDLDGWWNSRGIHISREEESGRRPIGRKEQRRILVWLAGAAVAAALTALAYRLWIGTVAPPPPLRVAPLTSLPGYVGYPCFSPDGKQIAFTWNGAAPDNFDLWIKDLAGGEPRRLTSSPANEDLAAWSPDGHLIAFMRWDIGNLMAGGQVLVVPQTGGSERVLLSDIPIPELVPNRVVSWTPDSRFVIAGVPAESSPMTLYVISVETGERRRLTRPPPASSGDDSATVSLDGKRVAFVRRLGPGGGNVFLLDLLPDFSAKGEPLQLTREPCCVTNPLWTGDGKEILYVKREDATSTVYRIPARSGGQPRAVSSIAPVAAYLKYSTAAISPIIAISRQGDKLVYMAYPAQSDIWRADLADPQPDGSIPAARWLPSSRVSSRPQISPDSRRVAFVSDRGGNPDIWIADADGSNALQVTSLQGPAAHAPRWSPDSREIVFHANVDGCQDLYALNVQAGKPRRLTHGPGNNMWASWSRNGKWLYFASNRTGRYQCWRMAVAGGEAVQITRGGGYGGFESADGRFLYYPKDYMKGVIWRVPVGGGEETPVDESVISHRGPANYAVRPEGIYTFATESPLLGARLQLYRFTTGNIEMLGAIRHPLGRGGMTLSPDGRWLLFADDGRVQGDLMLIENFR